MSLAQRVRDYRYSKGWGPDELASRAEISRTALYQIESGKTELPRAGTLRRIALALDVSMETLLGHIEAGTTLAAVAGAVAGSPVNRTARSSADWYPTEGAPLSLHSPRNGSKYENGDSRFGVEYPTLDVPIVRERELLSKLHELLASPLGEPIARIVEESYRLLPVTRVSTV